MKNISKEIAAYGEGGVVYLTAFSFILIHLFSSLLKRSELSCLTLCMKFIKKVVSYEK
jgi:hypothetical protein